MSLGVGLLSLFLLLGVIPNPYPFGCGKNCEDNCGEGRGVTETQGLSDEEVALGGGGVDGQEFVVTRLSIGAAGGNDTGTGAKGSSEGAGEEGHIGDLVDEEVAVGVGVVEGKVFVGTAGTG